MLEAAASLKELFQHAFTARDFDMAGTVDITEDKKGTVLTSK